MEKENIFKWKKEDYPWSIQRLCDGFINMGLRQHAHRLKNFHYPQVKKNVILS